MPWKRHLRYADGHGDALPADDRAYALVPERRRARVLVSYGRQHVPRAPRCLLYDEYLDVTDVKPARSTSPPGRVRRHVIFDGVATCRPSTTGAAASSTSIRPL